MDLLKHMTALQGVLVLLAVALLAGLAFFVGVSVIERRQAQAVAGMVPHASPSASRVAVVYFSRSGNTGLAARHVAKRLGATLYPLQVPEYELGLGGLARSAFARAWGTAPVDTGLGGSIPFIADLLEVFPDAEVLVTGVEDPDSRAHGTDESLHLGEFAHVCLAEALLLREADTLRAPDAEAR